MSRDLRIPDREMIVDDAPCARCGYDLRGVNDDAPCPECGLLAERSRRLDGHLTNATPGWLLGISVGVAIVLAAHVLAAAWPFALEAFDQFAAARRWRSTLFSPAATGLLFDPFWFEMFGSDLAALLLPVGIWLLTRPQRRSLGRDRLLRVVLRLASFAPLVAVAVLHIDRYLYFSWRTSAPAQLIVLLVLTIGGAPIPALMFLLLRRLALRVLHPRLAEHAAIVGVGFSATFVAIPLLVLAFEFGKLHGDTYWATRSMLSLVIVLAGAVATILFAGWSALNCVRFTVAFARAYRGARRNWRASDYASPGD